MSPTSRRIGRAAATAGAAFVISMTSVACVPTGSTFLTYPKPSIPLAAAEGPILVVMPLAMPGIVADKHTREWVRYASAINSQTMSAVRERFPDAPVADLHAQPPMLIPERAYVAAAGGDQVWPDEIVAVNWAQAHGATYLLVPMNWGWAYEPAEESFIDYYLPRKRIAIAVRLMRLQPLALVGRVVFRNRAALPLFNPPPENLLDDRYRKAVLRLVSSI
jgi:hypothetical protein